MDPNQSLTLIREAVARIYAGETDLADEARELAELVEELDGWLSRGGFLPGRWVSV